MRDRDRRSIKEFMKVEAEQFAAEQKAKERPIREAEKQLKETHRELYALEKTAIETGTDNDIFVDPATLNITMPMADAEVHNVSECKKFIQSHPEYFNSANNNNIVVDYLVRNGVQIFSALTIEKAVQRLTAYRLLEERPAPVEPVVTFADPALTEAQNYTIGIDPATGEEKRYSIREVNLMSADQYRRCFCITKADLAVPNRNW